MTKRAKDQTPVSGVKKCVEDHGVTGIRRVESDDEIDPGHKEVKPPCDLSGFLETFMTTDPWVEVLTLKKKKNHSHRP